MIQKSASPRKLGTFEGIGMILAMVAGVYVIAFGAELAVRLTGIGRANTIVWLAGVLVAFLIMRRYLEGYRYTLHEGVFYVERLFGKQSRVILKMQTADLVEVGEKSRLLTDDRRITERMICARCRIPVKTLAYRLGDQIRLMEFHADEELFAGLDEECRKNREEKPEQN